MALTGSCDFSSRRTFIGLAAIGYPASYLLGQTGSRNAEDPPTYSEDEIYRMLHSSPWATTARAEAPRGVEGGLTLVAAVPIGDQTSVGVVLRTLASLKAALPTEDSNAREPLAFYGQVIVRWESAVPILQITKTEWPVEFLDHYVISVTGLPAGVLSTGWNKASAVLAAQRHSPEHAEFVARSEDKLALLFAFQKLHPPIKEGDRAVSFMMNLSGIEIETAFQPKQMIYHGRLAL